MRVLTFDSYQYRNLTTPQVTMCPGRNVFVGQNGQGKTNILEALYILSHGRSHRTSTDRELVHWDHLHEGARIAIAIQSTHHQGETPTILEARFVPQTRGNTQGIRTQFRVDGKVLRSRSQVVGRFPTVSFFLSDLLMCRGTPSDRRRWLDSAAAQYDSRHVEIVSQYQRVREQKGSFLKQFNPMAGGMSGGLELLDIWNEQLAEAGAKLIESRLAYLKAVSVFANPLYDDLSGSRDNPLTLHYQGLQSLVLEPASVEQILEEPDSLEISPHRLAHTSPPVPPESVDWNEALRQRLREVTQDELRRGVCLVGPHRDDVGFFLGERDATAFGSQGQQRTVVLAVKLAELKLLRSKLGETPVLLLDDVMAELDPDRQRWLMEQIGEDSQVFLTTTHLDESVQRHFMDPAGCHLGVSLYQLHQGSLVNDLQHDPQPLAPVTLKVPMASQEEPSVLTQEEEARV